MRTDGRFVLPSGDSWGPDAPHPTLPLDGGGVVARFEERAVRAPEAEAVVCGEERLSYGELNRRANRLAHHLRGLGVVAEERVGVCLERSAELVVGLLGVLKAGGAYLPLDPAYPAERLAQMRQ